MINPYKEAAPWARAITLCVLGAAVFYLLGRWEAAVDRELEELRSETAAVIELIQARRAWSDSAKALEDSLRQVDAALEAKEVETRAAIASLVQADSAVVAWGDTAAMDTVLSVLRMRPLRLGDSTYYAATEPVARSLAARVLRLPIANERIDLLDSLVLTLQTRVTTLDTGWRVATARADSLEATLDLTGPILEAWQEYSGCKILGLFSCPSRTTAAIVGAVAGGLTVYLVSRE